MPWDSPLSQWVPQDRDSAMDVAVYVAWMEQGQAVERVTDPAEVERLRQEFGYLPRRRGLSRPLGLRRVGSGTTADRREDRHAKREAPEPLTAVPGRRSLAVEAIETPGV